FFPGHCPECSIDFLSLFISHSWEITTIARNGANSIFEDRTVLIREDILLSPMSLNDGFLLGLVHRRPTKVAYLCGFPLITSNLEEINVLNGCSVNHSVAIVPLRDVDSVISRHLN